MKVTGGMGVLVIGPSGSSSAAGEEVGIGLRQTDTPQEPLFGLDKLLTRLETSLTKLATSVRTIRDVINDGFFKVYINGGVDHPDWKGTASDKTLVSQFQAKITNDLMRYLQTILSVCRQFSTMNRNSRYDFEVLDRLIGKHSNIVGNMEQSIKVIEQSSVNVEYINQLANSVLTERTASEKSSIKQANLVQLATYLKNNMNSRYPIKDNIKAFLEELAKLDLSQVDSLTSVLGGLAIEVFKLLVAEEYFRRDGTTDNYMYTKQMIGTKLMINVSSSLMTDPIPFTPPDQPDSQPDSQPPPDVQPDQFNQGEPVQPDTEEIIPDPTVDQPVPEDSAVAEGIIDPATMEQ